MEGGIIKRNKDNNVNLLDVYDNLTDVIDRKVDNFSKKLEDFRTMETNGVELSDTQKNNKVAFSQNMESLGLVASLITDMSEEYATCERLIPLYQAEFENHKTDITWLSRSVNGFKTKDVGFRFLQSNSRSSGMLILVQMRIFLMPIYS